jgi:hypothetical protein
MSFTYATLKTAIQDYMEVTETTFVNNLPTFIKEAESRIFKLVQLPKQRKNVQGTLTSSNRFLATPTDFYAPFSAAIISSSNYYYMDFKHPSFMKEYAPSATTGMPKYYSLFDDTAFEVAPIPDSNYTVELHYLYKPASLTSGGESDTTFLSSDYPDAILYGSLAEAAVFLKEAPDVVSTFEGRFKEAIALIKTISEGRDTRDEYRYDLRRAAG